MLGIIFSNIDSNPAQTSLEKEFQKLESGRSLAIVGKIKTEPEIKIYGRKKTAAFIFESEYFQVYKGKEWPVKRRAEGNVQVFLNQPQDIPEVGDRVRLWGALESLPPLLNPGGFEYKRYLEAQDIHFILNIYGESSVKVLQKESFKNPYWLLSRIRQWIRSRVDFLFEREESLLVRALILGDRKNLKGKLLDDFLKTGTSHLLAISGLNISLVAGSLYLVLIVLRVGQKRAAFFALLTAAFQVAIAGFGIPVQRAGIMAGLGFLALILERERNGLNIFFLALLVLLLIDTRNLKSISFQLSFLSLFCLILFTRIWNQRWAWAEAWASSAAVLAGTFPVVVYHFSTFSPIGILTNILGIPLFHFILLTAFFALGFGFFPMIGIAFVILCRAFIKAGLGWIHFCAQTDWGYFFLLRPSWPQTIFYYAGLGFFVFSFTVKNLSRWYLRLFSFSIWSITAATFFYPKTDPGFQATFFSAGSNEIAHIQFSKRNQWLINSGRTLPGDQAQWILAPYLRSQGVKKLKGILFTDYRKRHVSGLETLQRNFSFQHQVYPVPEKKGPQSLKGSQVFVDKGSQILMPEGGAVEILGRDRGQLTFRVNILGRTLLFIPEISYAVFQRLSKIKNLKADILVLPVEAAADSAMLKSILTLTQTQSVISPKLSSDFEKILQEKGVQRFDLSKRGATRVFFEGGKIKIESFLAKP